MDDLERRISELEDELAYKETCIQEASDAADAACMRADELRDSAHNLLQRLYNILYGIEKPPEGHDLWKLRRELSEWLERPQHTV